MDNNEEGNNMKNQGTSAAIQYSSSTPIPTGCKREKSSKIQRFLVLLITIMCVIDQVKQSKSYCFLFPVIKGETKENQKGGIKCNYYSTRSCLYWDCISVYRDPEKIYY